MRSAMGQSLLLAFAKKALWDENILFLVRTSFGLLGSVIVMP